MLLVLRSAKALGATFSGNPSIQSRGVGLKAGQVVMTGSVMKTVFPEGDASYWFELEGIGFVEVHECLSGAH